MSSGIGNLVEDLIFYAVKYLGLCKEDGVYARNQLLELFKTVPGDRMGEEHDLKNLLSVLIDYALANDLIKSGEELRFETKIMGLVTPSPGLVIRRYFDIMKADGSKAATEYLYNLSVSNKYIRMEDISKNIRWYAEGHKGKIGITINLSKPEKDNKQVAAERNSTDEKYPKCLLCLENLGFCGTATHPARQNLRIIPVTLDGEKWHIQFSPYMYYDEHIIAFSDEHRPMAITPSTFRRLLDFVDVYPHYFLGSNADLPIVGGSILSHDHYQGGKKVLPMFTSPLRKEFVTRSDFTLGIRNWYNSVVTVKGTDRNRVLTACNKILSVWRNYSDESVGVIAATGETMHNTVTPIATKWGNVYCVDLILRNNRTDEAHPDGIFHPTADMHNIKKEGIGLIEAMGLFILPGRLKKEIIAMINILGKDTIDFAALDSDPVVGKHIGMLAQIAALYGNNQSPEFAQNCILQYINEICLKILDCTAVFKSDEAGRAAFDRFTGAVLR